MKLSSHVYQFRAALESQQSNILWPVETQKYVIMSKRHITKEYIYESSLRPLVISAQQTQMSTEGVKTSRNCTLTHVSELGLLFFLLLLWMLTFVALFSLFLSLYLSLSSVSLSFFLSRSASCCLCFICFHGCSCYQWCGERLVCSWLCPSCPTSFYPFLLFHLSWAFFMFLTNMHRFKVVKCSRSGATVNECFSRVVKLFWLSVCLHGSFPNDIEDFFECEDGKPTHTHTPTHTVVHLDMFGWRVCGCVHRGAVWREAGFLCSWAEPMPAWLKVHSNPPGIQVSPLTRCWDLYVFVCIFVCIHPNRGETGHFSRHEKICPGPSNFDSWFKGWDLLFASGGFRWYHDVN